MDLWLERRAWFIQEAASKQLPPLPPLVAAQQQKICPILKVMSWIQIHEPGKQKER